MPLIALLLLLYLRKKNPRNAKYLASPPPYREPQNNAEVNDIERNEPAHYKAQSTNQVSTSAKLNLQVILALLTLIVLIIQLYIYWRQTKIMEKQVWITSNQMEIQQHQEESQVEVRTHEFISAQLQLMILYPPFRTKSLEDLPIEDQAAWVNKVRNILDSQINNPELIKLDTCYGGWLQARLMANEVSEAFTQSPDKIKEKGLSKMAEDIRKAAMCNGTVDFGRETNSR